MATPESRTKLSLYSVGHVGHPGNSAAAGYPPGSCREEDAALTARKFPGWQATSGPIIGAAKLENWFESLPSEALGL